jgi:hypothetical protein
MVVDPFISEETLSDRLSKRRMPFLDQNVVVVMGRDKESRSKHVNLTFRSQINNRAISIFCSLPWVHDKFSAPQHSAKQIHIYHRG